MNRLQTLAGLVATYWPNRSKRINFSNPVNGRLWLNLLEPHSRHGLHFKKNLHFDRNHLGFSFSSNANGFRGPDNTRAGAVLLGTSFAMGLSADNGSNWYDLLLDPALWFNAGMPVGPRNHVRVLEDLYRGDGDVLLYLYHPNIWMTARNFIAAEERGLDIFQSLRWRTNMKDTLRLYPKWVSKEAFKAFNGLSVYEKWGGETYFFNALYCAGNFEKDGELRSRIMNDLRDLFGRFRRVVAVRVPIKEELAADLGFSDRLTALLESYDAYWDYFCANVPEHVSLHKLPRDTFGPADFHPYDTHWTAAGNARFADQVHEILAGEGLASLCGAGRMRNTG